MDFREPHLDELKKILISKGYTITDSFTLVSNDSPDKNYNLEFSEKCLKTDWTLLLNDYNNKKMYIFYIPKRTFDRYDFTYNKEDFNDLININIVINDKLFVDSYSSIEFNPFLFEVILYSDLE